LITNELCKKLENVQSNDGSPERRPESTAVTEKTAKMMGFQPIFLGEILVFFFAAL